MDHDETNDPSQVTLTGEPSKQQPSATGEAPQDGSPPKPAEAAKPAEAKP